MAIDSPIGISIAFGTSTYTAQLTGLQTPQFTRKVLNTTTLSTTGQRTSIPGKLIDTEPFDISVYFDPDDIPPISAAAETITITFPVPSGGSTGATLAGTGFLVSWVLNEQTEEEDSPMSATLTIRYDGLTDAAWTAST